MLHLTPLILGSLNAALVLASPAQQPLSTVGFNSRFYDVQAHRGGRGNTVESTLASFAWGLVDGATTLELDNGITLASSFFPLTRDGEVVVWHDEEIFAAKCSDTGPIVPDDPMYPYVGKLIANLTLAQIKTLDCGSQRQQHYPQQLLYPGARIQTLQEVLDFVECADPSHRILWNIESKINPQYPNRTVGVQEFVRRQHAIFSASPYYRSITYQSFDWRTLIAMKELDPTITISALIEDGTVRLLSFQTTCTSPWLAGLRLDDFPGPSLGERMAQAAHAINADILSPSGTAFIPSFAHSLSLRVKPWTLNSLDRIETLVQWGADGIITDYPNVVRRWAKQQGLPVAPKYPKERIFSCLKQHVHKDITV
ncbi:PLC-like phosphodiesterase [Melanogaster broomeanus]|nr:PLC-like phosphodiesterase [Melanogaster broomeanus]